MKWHDVREQYPDKWILVEALQAQTTEDDRRIVEQWSVIDVFPEYYPAMQLYKELHRQSPQREMYVTHTQNEEVTIKVRHWLGIRSIQ
jgi:hypothetical protein